MSLDELYGNVFVGFTVGNGHLAVGGQLVFRLLIVETEHFLEFLAVVVLPCLVGIIIFFGQMILLLHGSFLFLCRLFLLLHRFFLLLRGFFLFLYGSRLLDNVSCGRWGLRCQLNVAHLGEFTHLSLDFIGDDIGRVLFTQAAGDEHEPFYLIHMRQHFLYRHVHNHL